MPISVNELENGMVSVKIRSKRGTETRDQDEVTVEAIFNSLAEAEDESYRVDRLVRERMEAARNVKDSTAEIETVEQEPEISKIYLGEGSKLSGWIPIPREIIFNEIAPMVTKNIVTDEELPGVKVNFSKDVPISGWNEVDAEVVSEEIEPLVESTRLD